VYVCVRAYVRVCAFKFLDAWTVTFHILPSLCRMQSSGSLLVATCPDTHRTEL